MRNQWMKKSLRSREALDVRKIGAEIKPGIFQLSMFAEDKDYCDAKNEEWIWSIGVHTKNGNIFASTDARFYRNRQYVCMWLR